MLVLEEFILTFLCLYDFKCFILVYGYFIKVFILLRFMSMLTAKRHNIIFITLSIEVRTSFLITSMQVKEF